MKKIFAANWKLFKGPKETRAFFSQWSEAFTASPAEVVFFPSAFSLEAAITSAAKSTVKASYELSFGAQNVYSQAQGAFTGENSAVVVKEMGGKYALVGHSERRALFQETDEQLAEKVAFVQSAGLVPMFCIGETLVERESGRTQEVLQRQLNAGLKKADPAKPLVVAYEPVWAIGTGKVATSEQVRETHQYVFEMLKALGHSTPILYGGSVKPDNAAALFALPHVDGFLVGGASLDVASFKKICDVATVSF
jgi:triosephosphate isomerase